MCLLIPFLALSLPQSLSAEIRGSGTSVSRGKSICTFFCDYMSFFFTVSNFIIRNSDKVSKTKSHKIIITFSFIFYYLHCYLCESHACVGAKLLQLCSTLCDTMNGSLPGSSVHGILHARTLKWVARPSSRGSFRPRD